MKLNSPSGLPDGRQTGGNSALSFPCTRPAVPPDAGDLPAVSRGAVGAYASRWVSGYDIVLLWW